MAQSRRPRIVHVEWLWAAVEEGPPSSPDSEVGSDSEVVGDGEIDNVADKARDEPFCGQSQRQNASADRLRRRARSGEIWLGVKGGRSDGKMGKEKKGIVGQGFIRSRVPEPDHVTNSCHLTVTI
ncbi:hypothetical protein E2C01_022174 [Portunus trituberculatus]|uniref:Uncharacterized protein n=1 Tax=Portunus trituberculatus TaxID=210409 RepID=A0A5B7E5A9_PORTR|nr:hypothetical protein [Portunus trituberculatus]